MEEEFNTLILLGNGFDVAYKFKTKYCEFVESEYFQNLLSSNSLCKKIQSVKEHNNCFDLEMELYNYSLALTEDYGREGKEAEENAKIFKREYKELKAALQQYIKLANEGKTDPSFDKIIHKYWLPLSANTHIISFNYTAYSLTKFASLLTNKNINQVHASVNYNLADKKDTIVLGIDESMKVSKLHSFLYKSHDPNINIREFPELVNKANRYIIYGCSLGETDEWYFKQIFKQKGKLFEVYYYGDNEDEIISRIHELSGSLSDFKGSNTLRMYDASNKESEIKQREEEINGFQRH